jgi:hypothetical protein
VSNTSFTLLLLAASALAQDPATPTWKFAVSGDSRNCGDIVMPAIAQGVLHNGAEFYWHLGDFRAIYTFDEDMVPPAKLNLPRKPMFIASYLSAAWPDFIVHQMAPFGDLPVFLAIGNHETIPPSTRDAWLIQFADWLESPTIRAQRLKDNPQDRKLHSYYHWIKGNVDFITLDNASEDQFDAAQLNWFVSLIQRDEASQDIRAIVVGMHAALPGSIGHSHSMGDWAQGDKTGREVYQKLWHAQDSAHKRVYMDCRNRRRRPLPHPFRSRPRAKIPNRRLRLHDRHRIRRRLHFIRISKAPPRRSPHRRSRHVPRASHPLVLRRKQTVNCLAWTVRPMPTWGRLSQGDIQLNANK